MSVAEKREVAASAVLDNLLPLCAEAERAAQAFDAAAKAAVRRLIAPTGKVDAKLLEREQFAAHGYAWVATYVAGLAQMRRWSEALAADNKLGELEALLLQAAFGEYLGQLTGGIAVSQVEIVRPADLGMADADVQALQTPSVRKLAASGNTAAVRQRIAALL
ncbi:MAG TPA: acyl-CoA dehydrogenase, partial [Vineibacter sp.]|nr:acyl-CoA dehydrogenase [Vineibacter sp.]